MRKNSRLLGNLSHLSGEIAIQAAIRRPGTSSRWLGKNSAVSCSRGIGTLTVTPDRLEEMLTFPNDCFLYREWWNDLMDHREKEAAKI